MIVVVVIVITVAVVVVVVTVVVIVIVIVVLVIVVVVKMALWVDKHKPNQLKKLSLHEDVTLKLQSLALSSEIPHLMFYGPPGSG